MLKVEKAIVGCLLVEARMLKNVVIIHRFWQSHKKNLKNVFYDQQLVANICSKFWTCRSSLKQKDPWTSMSKFLCSQLSHEH